MKDVLDGPTPPDSPTILKGTTIGARFLDTEAFVQLLNQQIAVEVDDTSGMLISPLGTITLEGFTLADPNTNTPGIATEDSPGEFTLRAPLGVADSRLTVTFTDTGAGTRTYSAAVETLVNGSPEGEFSAEVFQQGSSNDFGIQIFAESDLSGLPIDDTVFRLRLTYLTGSGDRTISLTLKGHGRLLNVRPREAT